MFAVDLKQNQGRLNFMDEIMKSGYYQKIDKNTLIFAPTLWNSHSYTANGITEQDISFGFYSKVIHQKEILIFRDKTELIDSCKSKNSEDFIYYFILKQAYRTNDYMLISAKLNMHDVVADHFYADTLDVFVSSYNQKGILTYSTNNSSSTQIFKSINIKKYQFNAKIWHSRIIDKRIDNQSVNLSFLD